MVKCDWTRTLWRAGKSWLACGSLTMLLTSVSFGQDAPPPPADPGVSPQPAPVEVAPGTGYDLNNAYNSLQAQCQSCVEQPVYEACEEEDYGCLMHHFDDACGGNWLHDNGFILNGWLSQGFTWNPDNPRNNNNAPVTFNDRADEYQMNQLYLIFGKTIDQDACEWQHGFQVDMLYGTDYYYTQAFGLELEQDGTQRWNRQRGPTRTFGADTGAMYGFALPQAYVEFGGHGLSVKAGHFYTIIGYEVVPATGNFFYSHAYTMQYGEPFTHTGVLANYKLSDSLSVSAGIHNGWDAFDQVNDNMSFLGGITWTSADENLSLAFGITTGNERLTFDPVVGRENRTMYSIVGTVKLTEKLTYVIQHDHGWQDDGDLATGNDAEWYGINQYLFYEINETLKAGLRGEWFRDDDAVRVVTTNGAFDCNYYEITAGLNWNICDNLLLRPEARWDWADNGARPYLDGTEGSQFLLATDLIWTF